MSIISKWTNCEINIERVFSRFIQSRGVLQLKRSTLFIAAVANRDGPIRKFHYSAEAEYLMNAIPKPKPKLRPNTFSLFTY